MPVHARVNNIEDFRITNMETGEAIFQISDPSSIANGETSSIDSFYDHDGEMYAILKKAVLMPELYEFLNKHGLIISEEGAEEISEENPELDEFLNGFFKEVVE